jgi:hypothetical protein
MKRKERHLTVTGWVVVGLLDTLAGVISGGLMALWQLPSTYRWRGYWAIGGEWILVVGAIIIAVRLTHEIQMHLIFGGKKHGKVRTVSQGHNRPGSNRSGVRSEMLRQGVRKEAATCTATQKKGRHTA